MLITLAHLSAFFQENNFLSTNVLPISPSNTPPSIHKEEFRGYQMGTLTTKKVKKIYYLIL